MLTANERLRLHALESKPAGERSPAEDAELETLRQKDIGSHAYFIGRDPTLPEGEIGRDPTMPDDDDARRPEEQGT